MLHDTSYKSNKKEQNIITKFQGIVKKHVLFLFPVTDAKNWSELHSGKDKILLKINM